MRGAMAVAMSLVWAGTAAGQQAKPAEQRLEAIRAELQQLRQELRTLVGAAQRAQILIARVQIQESVVRRLEERVDNARDRVAGLQTEQKQMAFELKRSEELLGATDDAKAKKDLEDTIAAMKASVEQKASAEQETQARLTEAEEQLRIEQGKLSALQSDLEEADKRLK